MIEANPQYAHIWYPNGKKTTIPDQNLVPKGNDYKELNSEQNDMYEQNIT